jgi:hypothetical protein
MSQAMTCFLIENPSASGQRLTVNEVYDGYSVFHHLNPGETAQVAMGACESIIIRRSSTRAADPAARPTATLCAA